MALNNREVNLSKVPPTAGKPRFEFDSGKRKLLSQFGWEYFDDPNFCGGYRGFKYDGRWREIAQKMTDFFSLSDGAKILDIGCSKGFLLYDFKMINQTFDVYGIDISNYAIENSMPTIKNNLTCTSCTKLPYEESTFDLVLCMATLHNLPCETDCRKAISEINRVGKNHKFVMVHTYKNVSEKQNVIRWEPTIQTVLSTDEWMKLFNEENYQGHYWFQTFTTSREG